MITPCLNAANLVGDTARSVITQSAVVSGRIRLQYVVCDGGSSDGTPDIVREVCGPDVTIIEEPDEGPYDALVKGLKQADGDVIAYLNAGDMFFEWAFDVVADVFDSTHASWLTGLSSTINDRGQVVKVGHPFRYRSRGIRAGMYGRVIGPAIQQESTFWSRRLMERIDIEKLRRCQLAGDYYLWHCFAEESEPTIVEAQLGAFRVHAGQRSENTSAYRTELNRLRKSASPLDLVLAFGDHAVRTLGSRRLKRLANPEHLARYNHSTQRWS